MELRDHQKKCVEFITHKKNRGLILYHGLGTGKTFTSISMFESLFQLNKKLKAIVVVPAKLIANYEKEIDNANVQFKNSYFVYSYDGFSNISSDIDELTETMTGLSLEDEGGQEKVGKNRILRRTTLGPRKEILFVDENNKKK